VKTTSKISTLILILLFFVGSNVLASAKATFCDKSTIGQQHVYSLLEQLSGTETCPPFVVIETKEEGHTLSVLMRLPDQSSNGVVYRGSPVAGFKCLNEEPGVYPEFSHVGRARTKIGRDDLYQWQLSGWRYDSLEEALLQENWFLKTVTVKIFEEGPTVTGGHRLLACSYGILR
jgi:hypothetical protein